MSDKQLPEVYEETDNTESIMEETIVDNKKTKNTHGFISKTVNDIKRAIYIAILIVFAGISAVLFIQNKIADKENEKLAKQMEDMEDSIEALQSKLDATEQKRFDRVETETVQIMKELLAVSDLTTYTYEYTNETTESSTRMLPLLGWDIPGTTNKVTIKYSGIINVGYDMNNIEYELSQEEKVIYVTLPEATVLDNYIKFDDLTCICENNIMNPIKTDSIMEYFQVIETNELEKAEAYNIYDKADEQLKQIIGMYFKVFPDYKVEFL